jgi:hypothetical protein
MMAKESGMIALGPQRRISFRGFRTKMFLVSLGTVVGGAREKLNIRNI